MLISPCGQHARCIGDTMQWSILKVLFLIFGFLVVFILLTPRAVASRYNDTKSIWQLDDWPSEDPQGQARTSRDQQSSRFPESDFGDGEPLGQILLAADRPRPSRCHKKHYVMKCEAQRTACQNMPPKPSKTHPGMLPNPPKWRPGASWGAKMHPKGA